MRGLAAFLGLAALAAVVPAAAEAGCAALLNHSFPPLESGQPRSLCEYRGKVVLVEERAA